MKRYELFCRKLVLERHYAATALLASDSVGGVSGEYGTPAPDLSISRFARMLTAHLGGFAS